MFTAAGCDKPTTFLLKFQLELTMGHPILLGWAAASYRIESRRCREIVVSTAIIAVSLLSCSS